MNFPNFRTKIGVVDRVISYIIQGLSRLTFVENFESFEITESLPPMQEVRIENKLKPFIPRYFNAFDLQGNGVVVRGDTEWNELNLWVKNKSTTSTTTARLVFFK